MYFSHHQRSLPNHYKNNHEVKIQTIRIFSVIICCALDISYNSFGSLEMHFTCAIMNHDNKLTANILSSLVAVRYIKQPIRLLYWLSSTYFPSISAKFLLPFHWCTSAFAIFHVKFLEYFLCVLPLAYEDSIIILHHLCTQKVGHQAKVVFSNTLDILALHF